MSKKKQNTQTFEDENENTEFISKPLRNFRNKLQRVKRRDQEFSQEKALKEQSQDIKNSLECIEQSINVLESVNTFIEQKEKKVLNELEDTKGVVSKHQNELNTKDKTISDLQQEIKNLKNEIKNKDKEIEGSKKLVLTINQNLEKLEKKNKENETVISNQKKQIDSLTLNLQKLQKETKEKDEKIKSIGKIEDSYQEKLQKVTETSNQQIKTLETDLELQQKQFEEEKSHLLKNIDELKELKYKLKQKHLEDITKEEQKFKSLLGEYERVKQELNVAIKEKVKYEEEFIEYVEPKEVEQVLKTIQIIDFFDITKPDGIEIRKSFLQEQNKLLKKSTDFNAFDYFSKIIRGPSSKYEENLKNGNSEISKLLLRSNEEFSYGITYQKLYEQINELNSSSIYLNQLPTLPITDQTIEIPSEEAILSTLSSFMNLKEKEEEVWTSLNNSLYQSTNNVIDDDELNQPLEEEKVEDEDEEREDREEKDERREDERETKSYYHNRRDDQEYKRGNRGRWIKRGNERRGRGRGRGNERGGRGRGTPIFHRV